MKRLEAELSQRLQRIYDNTPKAPPKHLIHLFDQCVDLVFPITQIATLHKVLELPGPETPCRVAQLEWPQEVACLFEVRSNGDDFMDQVLHTDNSVLPKVILDQGVVSEGDALLVDLAISTLVDQLADCLQVGVAVGDVWLDDLEHLRRGFCEADEYTVVDLQKS